MHGTRTLGHLHIPKTAGTSLNAAVAEAMGVKSVYFNELAEKRAGASALTVPSGGPARELVLWYPFFAGHLSIGQLQSLNRSHIFSVLTDPRARLVKQFRWVARGTRPKPTDILSWLVDTFSADPSRSSPALHMIHWGARPHDLLRAPSRTRRRLHERWVPNTTADFDALLKHLIVFLATTPESVLEQLYALELIPRVPVAPRLNENHTISRGSGYTQETPVPEVSEVIRALDERVALELKFIDFVGEKHDRAGDFRLMSDEQLAEEVIALGLAR